MKRFLQIVILVALVATVLNDAGRYLTTRYYLDPKAEDLAKYAADQVRTTRQSREQIGTRVATQAQAAGIEVTAYDQSAVQVTVYTRARVEGTWVLGRIAAMTSGRPADAPLYVRSNKSEYVQ